MRNVRAPLPQHLNVQPEAAVLSLLLIIAGVGRLWQQLRENIRSLKETLGFFQDEVILFWPCWFSCWTWGHNSAATSWNRAGISNQLWRPQLDEEICESLGWCDIDWFILDSTISSLQWHTYWRNFWPSRAGRPGKLGRINPVRAGLEELEPQLMVSLLYSGAAGAWSEGCWPMALYLYWQNLLPDPNYQRHLATT